VDLNNSISKATVEIFQTMLMMDAVPGAPLAKRVGSFRNSVSGIVGLAGPSRGTLAIHIPEQTALKITSSFLCTDVDQIDEDVKDAIGELANMVAGSIKTDLSHSGADYKLSIPSVVCGANIRSSAWPKAREESFPSPSKEANS
jgi:chemotaxis protein CheX